MLLFLPGLICDARIYAPQLAAFPESRAVDGYGQVDTLEGMARVVLEQAPESFDLFGHSMGGRVALEILRMAPERVERLALLDTGVHPPSEGEAAKRRALLDAAVARQIPLDETLAVGDGANDIAMIRAAGLGIAYRAKPAVAAVADARIEVNDLTALLYAQGYARKDWVEN